MYQLWNHFWNHFSVHELEVVYQNHRGKSPTFKMDYQKVREKNSYKK